MSNIASLRREDHPTKESHHKAVVREFYRLKNERDWDAVDAILVPEFTTTFVRFYGGVEEFDTAWLKAKWAEYVEVFPDLHHEVHEIVAEGDWVVARQHYTGTHRGEIHGVAPTGRQISVHQHLSFEFRDGRIADMYSTADLLSGFWRKIGVRPPAE